MSDDNEFLHALLENAGTLQVEHGEHPEYVRALYELCHRMGVPESRLGSVQWAWMSRRRDHARLLPWLDSHDDRRRGHRTAE
jgi:hypothetical protein